MSDIFDNIYPKLHRLHFKSGHVIELHNDDFDVIYRFRHSSFELSNEMLWILVDPKTDIFQTVKIIRNQDSMVGMANIHWDYTYPYKDNEQIKCDCGAIHTSFPKFHLNWCSLQGNV